MKHLAFVRGFSDYSKNRTAAFTQKGTSLFWRLLRGLITSSRQSVLLIFLSLLMGSAICATLISLSLEITQKVSREFRSYGANILITPASSPEAGRDQDPAHLLAEDLPRIKTVFWRHNILNAVPYLYGLASASASGRSSLESSGEVVIVGTWFDRELPLPEGEGRWPVGLRSLASWWDMDGAWPALDRAEAVAGGALADRLGLSKGDDLLIRTGAEEMQVTVTGIVTTGSSDEEQLFLPLEFAQTLLGRPGQVDRVLVNALTNPLDALGRKDPDTMTPTEYDRWFCTPYVASVAKDLEGGMRDSSARPIWRVAESEGRIFDRLRGLFGFLVLLTFGASVLSVSSTLSAMVLERKDEIGLMKALGASNLQVSLIFVNTAAVIALASGLAAALIGRGLVEWISLMVFESSASGAWLLEACLGVALGAGLVGVLLPLRSLRGITPIRALE